MFDPQTDTPQAETSRPTRREFVTWSAQLALASSAAGLPGLRLLAEGKSAVNEPWARIEELGQGLWAVISKPLNDRRTLCNGGLVAGKERVLAIESYVGAEGSAWVGETSRKLAGHWPTDVVITHFHGDHVNGLGGFLTEGEERPRVWMTAKTLELVRKSDAERDREPEPARAELLEHVTVLDPDKPTDLDLGGRTVRLHPRGGHTPSDVTVELDEPSLVYFGDLVWNEMFPNYRDAIPTELSKSVRAAVRKRPTVYVPGHGPLSDQAAVGRFLVLIDDVEEAARRALEKGISAEDAAKIYQLPEPIRDWHRFSPNYFEVAMRAWHRELGQGS